MRERARRVKVKVKVSLKMSLGPSLGKEDHRQNHDTIASYLPHTSTRTI